MSTADKSTEGITTEPETPARHAAPISEHTVVETPTGVVAEPVTTTRDFDQVVVDRDPAELRAARSEAYTREKEEFGGFKFGSAFFGWLTASGLTIILLAIVGGTGVALGLGQVATDAATGTADANTTAVIGIGGLIAVALILFVSYLAGGYVAGRMARFSGAKQGIAVWLWAIAAAIVLAIVAAIAGQPALANLNAFPRIPINEGTLTATGITAAVLAAIIPLVAAIIGGLIGMRFHRKVDRVGFGA